MQSKLSFFLLVCLVGSSQLLIAQNSTYSWVFFEDKGNKVECFDEGDPVYEAYVQQLICLGIEVHGTTKWFNAACVKGFPIGLDSLPYVKEVKRLGHYKTTQNQVVDVQEEFSYGQSDVQLKMLDLDHYHKLGYTGRGVTIALFDGGFFKADSLKAFDSMWANEQIIGYRDFLYNNDEVFIQDGHGKSVLSIAGLNYPDSMMGAAPHANFILARTETVGREIHLEEYNWIKALEWADSLGADIIHSSLGYSIFDSLEGDYSYADMDGETTIITKATDVAFARGIFVTNSAGNEGAKEWHYITAPCDGKHVLCVGAVDSFGQHAAFSSYGPSADGRVKPEVMAMGHRVSYIHNNGTMQFGSGTSFSGPIIAGMVACLKQAHPTAYNTQIFDAIIRSSDRYNNPDTAYGYGIPNVLVADILLRKMVGLEQAKIEKLLMFPNPANTEVLIQLTSNFSNSVLEVIDNQGQMIMKLQNNGQEERIINTSPLASGLYIVRLSNAKGAAQFARLAVVH